MTLSCNSDANPKANYTWYKTQTLLSKEQLLVFNSIRASDSGNYHCTAENELGKSRSNEMILDVNCK